MATSRGPLLLLWRRSEPTYQLSQRVDDVRLAVEIRVGRHHRALPDGGASTQDDLVDVLVGDALLPVGAGEITRLRVQRRGGCAVALAARTVAGAAALREDLLG